MLEQPVHPLDQLEDVNEVDQQAPVQLDELDEVYKQAHALDKLDVGEVD